MNFAFLDKQNIRLEVKHQHHAGS